MSEDVFADYTQYGITNRNELIYTKEYRDINPCEYRGDNMGGLNDYAHPEDWIILKTEK